MMCAKDRSNRLIRESILDTLATVAISKWLDFHIGWMSCKPRSRGLPVEKIVQMVIRTWLEYRNHLACGVIRKVVI